MNNLKATQVLKELKDTLNNAKIKHFMSCGTLLGLMREGKLIEGDEDIDIGIRIEDWSPSIIKVLQQAGFMWTRQLGTVDNGLELTFSKNEINIDIFFYYKEKDYVWLAAWWKEHKVENMIKLKFEPFCLFELNIKGESYCVPGTPERYLEQHYGKDWRTPNPNWHWATSPNNIIQAPFDLNKKKTICLGMIVKNEGKIIAESLESLKKVIDYWVIVDTGSTDNTKNVILDVLKDVSGELIDRPWKNFGYNRSEVFKLAQSKADYTIMIDADMIIKTHNLDKTRLIADSYRILIEGNPLYYLPLMFKNTTNWRSVGVTHEYWHTDERNVAEYLKSISIDHRCCGDYRKEKFESDIKLLLRGLEDEPENSRYMFYLAQSYKDIGEYEKAIKWYKQRVNMGGWKEEVFYAMYMISYCNLILNKPFQESVESVFNAYLFNPKDAEPLYILLQHCRYQGHYNFGYYVGKIAERIKKPADALFVQASIYDYKILDELSICAYYVGKYQESLDLCNKLLSSDLLPFIEKDRVFANKNFCIAKLGGKINE